MQYLVTEELIDPGPLLPPEQLLGIMRQWVTPSMDALINLKSEGKIIAGGVRVGERALVLIFEAESNEELDSILQGLPLWGLGKWKVTPLETLEGEPRDHTSKHTNRGRAAMFGWSRGPPEARSDVSRPPLTRSGPFHHKHGALEYARAHPANE